MHVNEYIREYTFRDVVSVRNPKVVAIGGGTGLSCILRGLKKFTSNITAIVTMADDGGSSGILREDLGILPPGDVRNCILALADDENNMQELFNYRFNNGGLKGHNFGNLFLAAMNGISSNFYDAIRKTSDVLHIKGKVLPISLENMTLMAELENGFIVEGESNIPKLSKKYESHIKKIWLKPEQIQALPETVDAIEAADIIIIGPGSLYTSILPNVLVESIEQTILSNPCKKFYIGNIMTQPGETDHFTQEDHIKTIRDHRKYPNQPLCDYVIINNTPLPDQTKKIYESTGSQIVQCGPKVDGYYYFEGDFMTLDNGRVRHNSEKVAQQIFEIYVGH